MPRFIENFIAYVDRFAQLKGNLGGIAIAFSSILYIMGSS
jgi:hypothetical protein